MLQAEQQSKAVQETTAWLCAVYYHAEQHNTARRTIPSSKVRCKKTEGQHLEEAIPSFKEAVQQEI